jgi:shikimate kinase
MPWGPGVPAEELSNRSKPDCAAGWCNRFFGVGKSAASAFAGGLHAMANPDVNLYLVGFMGTGKTTIGRAVSQRLGFGLLDSDHEIESQHQKLVAQIFADEGEPAFRGYEREFIEHGHPPTGQVVACGGGLVVQPGMLQLLKSKGVVVCLHASIETILRRTAGHRHRPLLNVEDPEVRIRTLYAQREPIYRNSGTVILTDARPMSDIINHVLRAYRREAADWSTARGRAPA